MAKTIKLLLFISFFFLLFISVTAPVYAGDNLKFTPQVNMGDFKAGNPVPVTADSNIIYKYIANIYRYAIGAVGILATVVLMFGGFRWITAGGNAEAIGDAKGWIGAALAGLVLALTSYVILFTINPAILNAPNLSNVKIINGGDSSAQTNPAFHKNCSYTLNCNVASGTYYISAEPIKDCGNNTAGYGNCCCSTIMTSN